MKPILFALLVACGDNTRVKPDAAPPMADAAVDATPDALPPIPPGAHTWQWAWNYYVVAWCAQLEMCDPTDFPTYYGNISECVDANSGFCDVEFGYAQCQLEYPPDREPLLMQCVVGWLALSCSAYPDVPACDAAFAL